MMEGLQLPIPRRMALARVVLTVSVIVSVLLSWRLWAGERSFPQTPAIANYSIGNGLTVLMLIFSLAGLGASLFFRYHRLILFVSLLLLTGLVLADLNRLQPWLFVYASMLLVFVFYNGRVDDPNKFTAIFICLQVIVASVYFFCGVSQLNAWFVDNEFASVIAPLKHFLSERQFQFFKRCGAIVPYLLLFTGVGLIVSPIRYLAIGFAVAMHLVLLVLLFPSASNHNYALWFSNLVYALLTVILFSGKTKQRYFSPAYLFQKPLFYATLAIFVILPFFNRSGRWPDYLSSNFKSGKNKTVNIRLGAETYRNLPLFEKSFCAANGNDYLLDYRRWCAFELKVDCYPERPVFNSIYNYLSKATSPETAYSPGSTLAQR